MSCIPATLLKSRDFWIGFATGAIIAILVSRFIGF
jgi:hypothetical protein